MHGYKMIVKTWHELNHVEFEQLNNSHIREWKSISMSEDHHGRNAFFLLKDGSRILAQGQLVPINGVEFAGEPYNILGIGGIIANVKRTGYGKQIMLSIKDYLTSHDASGVGFTGLSDFYEKCGFLTNKNAIKRFVYPNNGQRITNTESDRVCYLDGSDKFMEKVLQHPDKAVLLPRQPDW